MKNRFNSSFAKVVYFVLSVIALIFPALINGFPLVYSDTGTYIASGFSGRVPFDRPLMYGLFVRHMSLATSLWFIIVLQAIFVWFVIMQLCRFVAEIKNPQLFTFILILFLSLTTGIANYTSQIMADIFSSILILSLCILLCVENLNVFLKVALSVLIVFSNMAHSSNLLVSTLMLFSINIFLFLFRKKAMFTFRRVLFATSLVAVSWLLVSTLNYAAGAGFRVSRASNIFMMARFAESGILKQYLDEQGDTLSEDWSRYRYHLPIQSSKFLWSTESPLYQGGCLSERGQPMDCWGVKNETYAPIVRTILTTPAYCMKYAGFIATETWKQVQHFETEPLIPMMENSPVMINVQWRFKADYKQYITAKQASIDFKYETINPIQKIVVISSLIFLMCFLFIKKFRVQVPYQIHQVIILCVTGLFFNAMVCCAFSMVSDRFQGRIIWLLPLLVLLVFGSIKKQQKVS